MTTTSPDTARALPSLPSVYRSRASVELKEFFRQRESVIFTLLLPVLLLVVFGAVLDYDIGFGVTFTQYFMAGIIAAGILGAAACTLLGIAISSIAKNGRSASATVTPFALLLQFISGVFFQFSEIPHWMQVFASLFPLKWMAQGLRSVFLPDSLAADEPAGGWELDRVALVLVLWCIAGLVLCIRSFRWQDR